MWLGCRGSQPTPRLSRDAAFDAGFSIPQDASFERLGEVGLAVLLLGEYSKSAQQFVARTVDEGSSRQQLEDPSTRIGIVQTHRPFQHGLAHGRRKHTVERQAIKNERAVRLTASQGQVC